MIAAELSRLVAVERVLHGAVEQVVTADPAECVAVARRLLVPAVGSLLCHFRLERADGASGTIIAHGRLSAEVTRECVVTLDEFPTHIDEVFRIRFVPAGLQSEEDDPDADDEIPYDGPVLDIGEAAVEQLALVLDPYPRKPDAELPDAARRRGRRAVRRTRAAVTGGLTGRWRAAGRPSTTQPSSRSLAGG